MAAVSSYVTLKTHVDNFVNYQKDRLLASFHNQIVSPQFGMRSEVIPQGKGDTVQWDFQVPLARPSAALAEATDVVPEIIYQSKKTATAEEWAKAVEVTRRLQLTHKHLTGAKGWNAMTEKVAQSMAEALDYRCIGVLATEGYRMRVDKNTDYEKNVSTTSDGAADGTTVISTSLTEADDFWNGGYCTIRGLDTSNASRASYWETQPITDFASGTLTVTAFPGQIKSGCTIHVCVGTGITAENVITTNSIARGGRQLKRHKGVRFNDSLVMKGMSPQTKNVVPGGGGGIYWVALIDQDHEYDFMQDVTWTDAGINQDIKALQNGAVKDWMGFRFFGTTQAWREDVDGTENESSGVVHPVIFLAQESYGISPVEEPGMKDLGIGGNFAVILNLKTPEDFSDYAKVRSSVAAQSYFAIRGLNSAWNVVMLGGCSD
jgi:hypothetical protein